MLKHLKYNGKFIYYEEEGSGSPVVFIHPPGAGRKLFRSQVASLKNRFRVIVPDLGGYGDSQGGTPPLTLTDRVTEVVRVIEILGLSKVHLVSYGSGCAAAQMLADTYPNLIKSLTLLDGYVKVEGLHRLFLRIGIKLLDLNEELAIHLYARHLATEKEFIETLKNHIRKSDIRVWLSDYQQLAGFNFTSRLNSLRMPVLLVRGGQYRKNAVQPFEQAAGCRSLWVRKRKIITTNWDIIKNNVVSFLEEAEAASIPTGMRQ
ncbi:alpha/beta fold hydrolase [Peribacillus sp. SCS-37]|uniref:alpha/beta fold hydrolase n=1 Tax=Paraperibacillus esterisolvens TaxID=3115296 RepID=UPI003905F6B4